MLLIFGLMTLMMIGIMIDEYIHRPRPYDWERDGL